MKQDGPAAAARIREMFRLAHEEAATILGQIEDPEEAFHTADVLDPELQSLHHETYTRIKAREAVRLRETLSLSLAQLAKRTNRSQSGAARLNKIGKEQEEEAPCPSSATSP